MNEEQTTVNNETVQSDSVQSVAERVGDVESEKNTAVSEASPTVGTGGDAPDAVQGFLDNPANRQIAQRQAHRLWAMLVGTDDVSTAPEREFKVTDVVHRTSLSHRTARELFNLLRTFGFFQWTDLKAQQFRLIFDPVFAATVIREGIVRVATGVLHMDFARWIALLRTLDGMTPAKIAVEVQRLNAVVQACIALPADLTGEPTTAAPTVKKAKKTPANSKKND